MADVVGKETETGISGKVVAKNIAELRGGVSYTQISRHLEERSGWPVNAVGIRRIESCERRVTVDDLVALAVALEVTPMTLLMPLSTSGDDIVSATAAGDLTARELLMWLRGDAPLSSQRQTASMRRALPEWFVEEQRAAIDADIDEQSRTQFELGALRERVKMQEQIIEAHKATIAGMAKEIEISAKLLSVFKELVQQPRASDGDDL